MKALLLRRRLHLKIVQTVFHPHRDSEVRVTRGCGWVTHEKDCYKDDNSDHLGTYCQCYNNLCNSAETVDPAVATFLFLIFAAVTYLWSGM
ncbi:jg3358 [Pararge aegeria aegeria]|uniref:Jg3358 protein n=1 Tax=Pararge aegeria aegeria TaxID=348720 RepID=A0A8S4RWH0_9NEOP|nr:jg3358 [Pararge aegeria aegeria]